MTLYRPQQIREVILKCTTYNKEWPTNEGITYYFNPEGKLVELKMYENYIEGEIELLVPLINITLDKFQESYRKARKHKL